MIIRHLIRTRFALTGRQQATRQINKICADYLALAEKIDDQTGRRPVLVPQMLGVDADMRNWSFFMLLEHNTIVNRSITDVTQSLARGKEPTGAGAIDPKKDVMPSANPGIEQIEAFHDSVNQHLQTVAGLGRLRGSIQKQHPVFGDFDAHRWHCMFGLHLTVHHKQAQLIVRTVTSGQ